MSPIRMLLTSDNSRAAGRPSGMCRFRRSGSCTKVEGKPPTGDDGWFQRPPHVGGTGTCGRNQARERCALRPLARKVRRLHGDVQRACFTWSHARSRVVAAEYDATSAPEHLRHLRTLQFSGEPMRTATRFGVAAWLAVVLARVDRGTRSPKGAEHRSAPGRSRNALPGNERQAKGRRCVDGVGRACEPGRPHGSQR
jgi:hypothetical protein